ncbi:MAG: hypothetical protein AAF598_00475, partial [Bacteroidota bacterium]
DVTIYPAPPTTSPTPCPTTSPPTKQPTSAAPTISFAPTSTFSPTATPSALSELGLVAHYPFDGDADDPTGEYDCFMLGATPTQDRFGTANSSLAFDGTASVVCPFDLTTDISGEAPRSICMWASISDYNNGNLFRYGRPVRDIWNGRWDSADQFDPGRL